MIIHRIWDNRKTDLYYPYNKYTFFTMLPHLYKHQEGIAWDLLLFFCIPIFFSIFYMNGDPTNFFPHDEMWRNVISVGIKGGMLTTMIAGLLFILNKRRKGVIHLFFGLLASLWYALLGISTLDILVTTDFELAYIVAFPVLSAIAFFFFSLALYMLQRSGIVK